MTGRLNNRITPEEENIILLGSVCHFLGEVLDLLFRIQKIGVCVAPVHTPYIPS